MAIESDDSNFTTLLVHRLPDALSRVAEGAAALTRL